MGIKVLITHPYFGSVWLSNCEIKHRKVMGEADDWQSGPNLPDPQPINIPVVMNFPVSYIKEAYCDETTVQMREQGLPSKV